ncbi:hypothetical protein LXL04_029827 [Taraxacum kok-saghyz]
MIIRNSRSKRGWKGVHPKAEHHRGKGENDTCQKVKWVDIKISIKCKRTWLKKGTPHESRSVRIHRQEESLFFYIKVLVYVRQLNLKLIYKNVHQLFNEMQSMINKLNVVHVQQLLANTLYLHNYIRYLIKHTNLWQFNPKLQARVRCIRFWYIITICHSLYRQSNPFKAEEAYYSSEIKAENLETSDTTCNNKHSNMHQEWTVKTLTQISFKMHDSWCQN